MFCWRLFCWDFEHSCLFWIEETVLLWLFVTVLIYLLLLLLLPCSFELLSQWHFFVETCAIYSFLLNFHLFFCRDLCYLLYMLSIVRLFVILVAFLFCHLICFQQFNWCRCCLFITLFTIDYLIIFCLKQILLLYFLDFNSKII